MLPTTSRTLRKFYHALLDAYGPQRWWPGDTPTEVIVGAILTQNTNWRNVERAIVNLREADLLAWTSLRDIASDRLAELIRPAGYYNVKARRLKCFVEWLWREANGDLQTLARRPLVELRAELLGITGIGPETADSILLYALHRPSFVVDAYTRRIVQRHGIADRSISYEGLKALFERNLPADVGLFNEYHALIVAVGKTHCRTRAQCAGCPLERFEHDTSEP